MSWFAVRRSHSSTISVPHEVGFFSFSGENQPTTQLILYYYYYYYYYSIGINIITTINIIKGVFPYAGMDIVHPCDV